MSRYSTVSGVTQSVPLHALLAVGRPADFAVCHDGQRLILWREFAAVVARMIDYFARRPEARWLVTNDCPWRFAAELLALLHAGKQVVIPPNSKPGTLAALAAAYDVRCEVDAWRFDGVDDASVRVEPLDPRRAIIDLYTSGSAGQHKRIRKTLAQFESEVATLELLWGSAIGTAAFVATVPHQHIYGLLFRLCWPLSSGRVFDAVTCAHPDTLMERLGQFPAAVLVASPAQLVRLPDLVRLPAMTPPRLIFSSGGPLPATAAQALAEGLGVAPIEIFGSTETGGVAARNQSVDGDLWTPFPGHRVQCAENGALLLRSTFLASDEPWLMDDRIELLADGRFRLCGRLDRVVKIEEKRLSLPDMEARLGEHAWVSVAAAVPLVGRRQTVGAVVVLSPAGYAHLEATERRLVVATLRAHLERYFDRVLLPRRWRFVESLPVDERGKLTQAALQAVFESPSENALMLPHVAVISQTSDSVLLDLFVPGTIAHFSGHFPNMPLLPGVVQIDWACLFARQYLPVAGHFVALEAVKFLTVILPDTALRLTLRWHAERACLEFTYASEQRKYSTGRLVFGGVQ